MSQATTEVTKKDNTKKSTVGHRLEMRNRLHQRVMKYHNTAPRIYNLNDTICELLERGLQEFESRKS